MNAPLDAVNPPSGLAAQFQRFALRECTEDPLYVALCLAIAEQPGTLALLQHAPSTQARPNILLAALHERVLSGAVHSWPSTTRASAALGCPMPNCQRPCSISSSSMNPS